MSRHYRKRFGFCSISRKSSTRRISITGRLQSRQAEIAAAEKRNLEETLAVIAKQPDAYARLLADMSDADFRAEMTGFDGNKISRGAFIVNLVLGGYAAYRTQLFLYLKSCGQEQLGTMNLWGGVDAPVPA